MAYLDGIRQVGDDLCYILIMRVHMATTKNVPEQYQVFIFKIVKEAIQIVPFHKHEVNSLQTPKPRHCQLACLPNDLPINSRIVYRVAREVSQNNLQIISDKSVYSLPGGKISSFPPLHV